MRQSEVKKIIREKRNKSTKVLIMETTINFSCHLKFVDSYLIDERFKVNIFKLAKKKKTMQKEILVINISDAC